jgi:GNAT superfamily N-acetyltransferase
MCEVKIRTAGEQDFDALDKLYYDFHQYRVREIPDRLQDLGKIENQDWSRLHQAFREIFTNKDAVIFLNEDNPLIVPHKYAHLQSIMVSEPNRKSGIGKKLMDVAQQWAREKGATEMRLDVWEFNQGTIQFYEKMGFHTLTRTLITGL